VARNAQKAKTFLPIEHVKLYMYQLSRALAYIHALGICHRDIKPQNLLVNEKTLTLKLCDFGSAKKLVQGEPNVSYICSRYYRAPELIFGATDYSTAIDVWSFGCVMAELLIGAPLFPAPLGVLCHAFFDELRAPGYKLSNGATPPPLFNFTPTELSPCTKEFAEILFLPHTRTDENWPLRSAKSGDGVGESVAGKSSNKK